MLMLMTDCSAGGAHVVSMCCGCDDPSEWHSFISTMYNTVQQSSLLTNGQGVEHVEYSRIWSSTGQEGPIPTGPYPQLNEAPSFHGQNIINNNSNKSQNILNGISFLSTSLCFQIWCLEAAWFLQQSVKIQHFKIKWILLQFSRHGYMILHFFLN